jgi:hypothetical protein
MRTKNAVIKKTKQGESPLAGRSIYDKFDANRYGRKCDPDALEAIHALHNALHLKSSPPSPSFDKQISSAEREKFWNYVATNYEKSWTRHDGTFFRKLADAMEVHQQANDPARTVVTGEIIICQERGLAIPTVSEMHKDLAWRGIEATRKTVENIYKDLGIARTAKRGAKPGTKQKSSKQGGESLR